VIGSYLATYLMNDKDSYELHSFSFIISTSYTHSYIHKYWLYIYVCYCVKPNYSVFNLPMLLFITKISEIPACFIWFPTNLPNRSVFSSNLWLSLWLTFVATNYHIIWCSYIVHSPPAIVPTLQGDLGTALHHILP